LPALPDVTSWWQLNLNFISMSTSLRYLIPTAKVNSLNLQQGQQLLQLLPALPDVTSWWQLNLNFISMSTSLRYLIPTAKVNSLNLQQGRE
jgi:hypothetical protein